jgi:hypothetical protein
VGWGGGERAGESRRRITYPPQTRPPLCPPPPSSPCDSAPLHHEVHSSSVHHKATVITVHRESIRRPCAGWRHCCMDAPPSTRRSINHKAIPPGGVSLREVGPARPTHSVHRSDAVFLPLHGAVGPGHHTHTHSLPTDASQGSDPERCPIERLGSPARAAVPRAVCAQRGRKAGRRRTGPYAPLRAPQAGPMPSRWDAGRRPARASGPRFRPALPARRKRARHTRPRSVSSAVDRRAHGKSAAAAAAGSRGRSGRRLRPGWRRRREAERRPGRGPSLV